MSEDIKIIPPTLKAYDYVYKYWIWEHLFSSYPEMKNKFNNDRHPCLVFIRGLIARTPRLVKAKSVAQAVGRCPYYARLIEWIGARGFADSVKNNLPGKGSLIHKLLSLAFPYIIKEIQKDLVDKKNIRRKELEEIIDESINFAQNNLVENNIPLEDDINNVEIYSSAKDLLLKGTKLVIAFVKSGFFGETNKLNVLTENQMISYVFHIWGTPDAIIENPKNRKAVVIEWKVSLGSTKPRITKVDKAQVYVYSLLEGERLGILSDLDFNLDAFLNILSCEDSPILPIIIRSRMNAYCNHPALSKYLRKGFLSGLISEKCKPLSPSDILEKYYKRIIVAAMLLSALTTSWDIIPETFFFGKKGVWRSIRKCCGFSVKGDSEGGPVFFNYIPKTLRVYAPKSCPIEKCPLKDACLFYFTKFEKDEIDRQLWQFRYTVLNIHLRSLLPYKGIYESLYILQTHYNDLESVLLRFSNGEGFHIDLACMKSSNEASFSIGWEESNTFLCDIKDASFYGRFDVFTHAVPEGKNGLKLIRRLRDDEKLVDKEGYPRPILTVRTGKPVLVIFISDNELLLNTNPLLAPNIFARVDEVSLGGQGDELHVVVRPISGSLKMQFLLALQKFFENCKGKNELKWILVFEVNADLTSIELETLDALHRYLKKIKEELENEKLEVVREEVDKLLRYCNKEKQKLFDFLVGYILNSQH